MIIHKWHPNKTQTVTTVGGKWSANTENLVASLCNQIYVKSASALTTFDVIVTDKDGIQIRRWLTATEVVNDLTPVPTEGIYTIEIDNASADEEFTVLAVFMEGRGA